jgi:hypothetical protein
MQELNSSSQKNSISTTLITKKEDDFCYDYNSVISKPFSSDGSSLSENLLDVL